MHLSTFSSYDGFNNNVFTDAESTPSPILSMCARLLSDGCKVLTPGSRRRKEADGHHFGFHSDSAEPHKNCRAIFPFGAHYWIDDDEYGQPITGGICPEGF